jgi:hypothetical protein
MYNIPAEGVMQPSKYTEFFAERVAQAAAQAWQQRAPGAVSWGLGHAVVGHNRRAVYADGTAKMYGDTTIAEFRGIEGYEDHTVETLFFWNKEGKLVGGFGVSGDSIGLDEKTAFAGVAGNFEASDTIKSSTVIGVAYTLDDFGGNCTK